MSFVLTNGEVRKWQATCRAGARLVEETKFPQAPSIKWQSIKHFGGKNYRKESKQSPGLRLFFQSIGRRKTAVGWESKSKRVEQNGLPYTGVVG